jgi:hypothetical protein
MTDDRPLFVPLRREWFNAFADGTKTVEWRKYGPRWNERTVRVGRRVILALGYQGTRRLTATVLWSRVMPAHGPAGELYGTGTPCMVFGVALDPREA